MKIIYPAPVNQPLRPERGMSRGEVIATLAIAGLITAALTGLFVWIVL